MKKLSVSAVVPVFNGTAHVGRALQSVLAQTIECEEIIVVDDHSTDDTSNYLVEWVVEKSLTNKVRLVSLLKNSGPGGARNLGWDIAECDVVSFLDADDVWAKNKIEIHLNIFQIYPEVQLIGGRNFILERENSLSHYAKPQDNKILFVGRRILLKNYFFTSAVSVKKSLPNRFQSGVRYAEDYRLWLEIIGNGHSAIASNAPLYTMFKKPYGEGGLSANLWKMEFGELLAILDSKKYFSILVFPAAVFSIFKFLKRVLF